MSASHSQWIPFLNQDIEEYVKGLTHVQTSDDDSGEAPKVKVDLPKLVGVLETHAKQKAKIVAAIPAKPLEAGLYCIKVLGMRDQLSGKHHAIMDRLLSDHAGHCSALTEFLDAKFTDIQVRCPILPSLDATYYHGLVRKKTK